MAVPARPVAGAVLESAWGQVVHDTAVGLDIQSGSFVQALAAAGSVISTVVFPRPFAAVPVVVAYAMGAGVSGTPVAFGEVASATQVRIGLVPNAGGNLPASGSVTVNWVAIGPRA